MGFAQLAQLSSVFRWVLRPRPPVRFTHFFIILLGILGTAHPWRSLLVLAGLSVKSPAISLGEEVLLQVVLLVAIGSAP
jgi:hypothetical protein